VGSYTWAARCILSTNTDHFLGAEVQDDEGDPDDAGGVHGEADELGLVEVLRQIARLERVQRAHGDQQQVETERNEHSPVRVLATDQHGDVAGRINLRRVGHRVEDR